MRIVLSCKRMVTDLSYDYLLVLLFDVRLPLFRDGELIKLIVTNWVITN